MELLLALRLATASTLEASLKSNDRGARSAGRESSDTVESEALRITENVQQGVRIVTIHLGTLSCPKTA